ncbi:uncharacterized protein BO97DRAFT_425073 [Aspergillus homomorphus CBS 101889]|uniref:malate dehydrogenase n=1 Tax=Aspergillus homomorphus (strain CBS 101889) TaxID=1450537 RepID=A0A395HWG9_ASPHC|nr:hypothetical protein BO97DRAFT_425073 [Aspergillus homomorphus CBS 101889]RAL11773.1 hypothetical protein BO97DRAFT_425073 [Aspergillus homomorphus CBS 101889]
MQERPFDEIALYDLVHVPGIATDLIHIDTKAEVTGHLPADSGLEKALSNADIVVVTAGIARKPGMTRDDQRQDHPRHLPGHRDHPSPNAISCIVTKPVNSTVHVPFGGDGIVKSKQGAGSATTCMAYARFRFVKAVLAGLKGENPVTEEAFVYLPGIEGEKETAKELGLDFFVVRTVLEEAWRGEGFAVWDAGGLGERDAGCGG